MVDVDPRTSKNQMPPVRTVPPLRSPTTMQPPAGSPRTADPAATDAYDRYLRLPELSKLWSSRDFPGWEGEPVVKPALQALEITFRFISSRAAHREWAQRLESLAARQLELVAAFCEEPELSKGAPTWQLGSNTGVLKRDRSSQEVWKVPGSSPVVSRTSEESLLPRLAAWERSEAVAAKLQMEVECQMRRATFTLGIGEPNLSRKRILDYDLVCRPARLHALAVTRRAACPEEESLHTCHQIMETWAFVGRQLLARIGEKVEGGLWGAAASYCWLLERVWKVAEETVEAHMLMDPDDVLRLKRDLGIRASSGSEALCFRSTGLMELTRGCSRELKRWVPGILGVEVDPEGGPRLQEAAMELLLRRRNINKKSGIREEKVQLLQAFQAIDAAVKKFFFGYRQVIVALMGSLEATQGVVGASADSLNQLFMEPPYFPSLDAAKTFLAHLYYRSDAAALLH